MPSLSTVTCYGRLIFHANSFHLPRDSFPKNEISSCDYGGRNDGFNFAREGYLKTSNLDRAHGKST
uniref:Uncharacterized protein n=1 Tax=Physcomitrium patens TaxID=3218 RepID=A0A7I4FNV9_PHYPA